MCQKILEVQTKLLAVIISVLFHCVWKGESRDTDFKEIMIEKKGKFLNLHIDA